MKIFFYKDIIVLIGEIQNKTVHCHHALQVVLNPFCITVNGNKYGKNIIINSGVSHYIEPQKECVSFLISPETIIGRYFCQQIGQNEILNLDDAYNDIFNDLKTEDSVEDKLDSIIDRLTRYINTLTPIDGRIQTALDNILSTCGTEVSIPQLSNQSYLSQSRFTHLFKEEVGLSVNRYIIWVKLICAAEYILKNNAQISEGAYKYDFSDDAHFSRTFKKTFGINLKKIIQINNKC